MKMAKPRLKTTSGRTVKPAPKVANSFYASPEWRALLAQIIKARGRRCEDPAHVAGASPSGAIYGDHIVELQDGGAPLDEDNVMLRCASCHQRKTGAERAKRMGVA